MGARYHLDVVRGYQGDLQLHAVAEVAACSDGLFLFLFIGMVELAVPVPVAVLTVLLRVHEQTRAAEQRVSAENHAADIENPRVGDRLENGDEARASLRREVPRVVEVAHAGRIRSASGFTGLRIALPPLCQDGLGHCGQARGTAAVDQAGDDDVAFSLPMLGEVGTTCRRRHVVSIGR